MHNCLSVPFDHLLAEGFNTRQADIRPANSVDTAFQLIAGYLPASVSTAIWWCFRNPS